MKRNALIIVAAVLIVLIIAGIFGWQRVTANAAATNARTPTATVTRSTLVANVSAAGNVSAPIAAGLAFASSGRVARVAVSLVDMSNLEVKVMMAEEGDVVALDQTQTRQPNAQMQGQMFIMGGAGMGH